MRILLLAALCSWAPAAADFPWRFGEAVTVRNLTVVPLLPHRKAAPVAPLSKAGWTSLSAALVARTATIEYDEEDEAYRVRNKGPKSLFVLAGELLTGGRQDVMITRGAVVAAGTSLRLTVTSEVHAGAFRDPGPIGCELAPAFPQLALAGRIGRSVKPKIRAFCQRLAVTPRTLGAALEARSVRRMHAAYRYKAQRGLADRRAVGAVYAVNGEVVGVDIFATPALFESQRVRLAYAYALGATGWLTEAIPTDTGDVALLLHQRIGRGDFRKALKELPDAGDVETLDHAVLRAYVLLGARRYTEAALAYDRAFLLADGQPGLAVRRGRVAARLGMGAWEAAIRDLRALRRKLPGDPDLPALIGHAQLALGREGDALLAFARARALAPSHLEATLGLARVAARRGDVAGAKALFAIVGKAVPHYLTRDARHLDGLLEEYPRPSELKRYVVVVPRGALKRHDRRSASLVAALEGRQAERGLEARIHQLASGAARLPRPLTPPMIVPPPARAGDWRARLLEVALKDMAPSEAEIRDVLGPLVRTVISPNDRTIAVGLWHGVVVRSGGTVLQRSWYWREP